MNKIKITALIITAFVFLAINSIAQSESPIGGTTTSCEASCMFGSCKITCNTSGGNSGGGAVCGCVYGMPGCACGAGIGAPQIRMSAIQKEKINIFIEVLAPFKTESTQNVVDDLNGIIDAISAENSESANELIDKYKIDLKKLSSDEKEAVNKFFEENKVEERL